MKSCIAFIICLLVATPLFAQQRPPGPGGGAEPFENPPPFNGPGPGRGGPGMPGQPPPMNPMMMQVDLLRGWLDLVERYARLSRDPVASGVAAVVSADDLFKGRPPEQAIDYFNKLLGEVKNETIQRAIRLELIELYGKNGQQKEALDQLRTLMVDVPPSPPPQGKP